MRPKNGVIEMDFHGFLVEDALRTAESIISYARMNREYVSCNFVTGRGRIQRELFDMLKDIYELDPVIPMSNSGMVMVDVD
ncbi:MAG: hypothetical protein V1647_01525 [Pseudomonadota bacterium]